MIAFRKFSLCLIFVGVLALGLSMLFGFKILPQLVTNRIVNSVRLATSDQFSNWYKQPFPMDFNVYVFNVTNPDEIMDGAKPIVEEVGPFVYKEFRQKKDVNLNDNNEPYQYKQCQVLTFDKENSPWSDEIELVVLNVAKNGFLQEMELFISDNTSLESPFPGSSGTLFHKIKVRDLFFDGYDFCTGELDSQELCFLIEAKSEEIPTLEKREGKMTFSFFNFKNNSCGGTYTVKSEENITNLGQIELFNGRSYLHIWKNEKSICNKVYGTDSSVYPPFIEKNNDIAVFSSDICRTVSMAYSKDIAYKEVPGFRSIMKKETFASAQNFPENDCFCIKKTLVLNGTESCFPDGLIDMGNCLKTPVVASLPHLLYADEEYSKTVEGLSPDEDKHLTFFDIEPNTGTPLRAARRMQFNMILRNMEFIDLTRNIVPSIIPLLWVEEKMELPDDLVQKLKDDYFNLLPSIEAAKWGLITSAFIILILVSFISQHLILKGIKRCLK